MNSRYCFILLILLIQVSCSPKNPITQKSGISDYHAQVLEDYSNNKHLNLTQEELSQISFFDLDPDYNCQCTFTENEEKKPFKMATYSGKTKIFRKYGTANCSIKGESIDVQLYLSSSPMAPSDYLFLPIMDLTSGEETYGGGRYIELKKSDIQNGMININFNHLYNPYCAFRDGFNCPVPPSENHLSIAIKAGEKAFGESH